MTCCARQGRRWARQSSVPVPWLSARRAAARHSPLLALRLTVTRRTRGPGKSWRTEVMKMTICQAEKWIQAHPIKYALLAYFLPPLLAGLLVAAMRTLS